MSDQEKLMKALLAVQLSLARFSFGLMAYQPLKGI